ncbi:MAG: DUF711 family protein [Treponema sp.]|nr:DUF711 family protein [Treponema sp.]
MYKKLLRAAGTLVKTGREIEAEYGIPIINKRVSVTRLLRLSRALPMVSTVRPMQTTACTDACGRRFDCPHS